MSRTSNVIRGTIWGNVYRLLMMLLPFVTRTIIIYKLGDQYVGLNSLFLSVLNVLNLADLGFSSAIVFAMYKPVAENDTVLVGALLNFYRKIYLAVGAVITAAGLAILPFLQFFVKGDVPSDVNVYILYLVFLTNTVIPYFLFGYRTSILYANQRNDVYSKILSISCLAQYVVQVAVLLIFTNYYVYLIIHTVAVVGQAMSLYWVTKNMYPSYVPSGSISTEQKKDITVRVSALLGHKIAATMIVSVNGLIISAFLGLETLAHYDNYYYIVSAVIGFTNSIITSSLPSIGNKLIGSDDHEKLETFKRLNFIWSWIVSFCTVCFLCLFQPFTHLWLGEDRQLPFYFVIVLCLYYYAWQFRVMGLNFKDAAGLWKNDWPKPYIGMTLNLLLGIILVNVTKDLVGVLIPTIFVMMFLYFPWETMINFKNTFKAQSRPFFIKSMFRFLITVIASIITYVCCWLVPGNGYASLFVKLGICCVVPNVVLLISFCKTDEFRYTWALIQTFIAKIKKDR